MMRWDGHEIVQAAGDALRERAEALDREQAVYGLDSLDELRLHPVIERGLWGVRGVADARGSGAGVWREQRYPGQWSGERGGRRKRSEGERCDFVLTQAGLPLRDPELRATLWAQAEAAEPEDAYWLEVKTVAQFESGGPFRRYSSELLSCVAEDVRKLSRDRLIQHAGLLLVLFTQSREVAEHDLHQWHERVLSRGYVISEMASMGFAITDRMGNGWCAAALFTVR